VTEAPKRQRRRAARLGALAVVLVLLVLFVAENFLTVEVRFFVSKTETRLAWALLTAAALGLAVGFLLGRFRRRG
jgi:uncharacterized integral membrane protein